MTPEDGQGRGEFKTILRQTLPCWHELSWEEEGPALVLRIHQSYTDTIRIKPDAPIVLGLHETFDLGDFKGDLKGNFGFGEALKNRGVKDGFYEFAIELPTIKGTTDATCRRCNGSGRDEDLDITCLECEGEGKELWYDWRRAREISASLQILTMRLPYWDHEVPTAFPQLITFESYSTPDYNALSGEIGIPLFRWLAAKPDHSQVPEAVGAMQTAYSKMFGERMSSARQHSFAMMIKNGGGLIASCPGEACGIYPDGWNFREERGYKFGSHNVGTPTQQLTLLAGLAALHDMARREI